MSSSQKPLPSIPQAQDKSVNETDSVALPKPGNGKVGKAVVGGSLSAAVAGFVLAGTAYFYGGTPDETLEQSTPSCVKQESNLTFDASRRRRPNGPRLTLPSSSASAVAGKEETPLQRSCRIFNAQSIRTPEDAIEHAANLPQDSTAPTAPAVRHGPIATLRQPHLGRRGSSRTRGTGDNRAPRAANRSKQMDRTIRPPDKLHRRRTPIHTGT